MPPKEHTVHPKSPMPANYAFLPKGNAYLTSLLRRKTLAANLALHVVKLRSETLGLRAPRHILDEVLADERATRDRRAACLRRRDDAAERDLEAAVKAGFPNIPGEDLRGVVGRALVKRSGRVGRTGLLGVDQKARLAVVAHVRHRHTEYDRLVRGPMGRNEARAAIKEDLERVLGEWRGASSGETKPKAVPEEEPKRQKPKQQKPRQQKQSVTSIPSRPRQPPAPAARSATRASARLQGDRAAPLAVLDVDDDDDFVVSDEEDSEGDEGSEDSCSEEILEDEWDSE